MNAETLASVVVESTGKALASVLWLHGLGADGHDFEPIVPLLGLAPELGVRFVFPHAPRIPVTINGGMVMPAWYDIQSLDFDRRPDAAGVKRSAAQLRTLYERERERGIPSEKIVLAGFSQGGAIALYLGLELREPLAGVMALSTYLPLEPADAAQTAPHSALEIFQGHGTADPMVPVALGMLARERLLELGCKVRWRTYPMGHQVSPLELQHIGAWLSERLAQG